jgi:hypothetical protein
MVEHFVELIVPLSIKLEHILMKLEQRLPMRDREQRNLQILALIIPIYKNEIYNRLSISREVLLVHSSRMA